MTGPFSGAPASANDATALPSPTTTSLVADPQAEELLAGSRVRARQRPGRADLRAQAVGGASFALAAVALVVSAPDGGSVDVVTLLAVVTLYAVAFKVEFEIGTGATAPTLLVVVPALFVLPPHIVPLAVAAGHVTSRLVEALRGGLHPARALLALVNSWYAMGPALVFVVAQPGLPSFADAGTYLLALVAMFVFDVVSSTLYDHFGLGADVRSTVADGAWVSAIDALLFPVGLLVAFAVADAPERLVLLCPLLAVLGIFGRERSKRITHALELGRAYRGTARLLGQVVEADDAYTGAHSKDVVELALAVGERMGLSAAQRRNLEFGALLHDIGKIAVPKEIINKPGKLTAEEWAIIEQHTIEGQRMLNAVGGVLGDAGLVVRSSHERWDGQGYPDGLRGVEIAVEARICTVCDAFAAMTTDRAYRKALPLEAAVAELHANAGAQFDPGVVDCLVDVLKA